MKKILIASVILTSLVLTGCGSDSDEDAKEGAENTVEATTNINSVEFADLENHTITIRERHIHDAEIHTIVFCAGETVAFGSHKNGTYTTSDLGVNMTFTSTDERLEEEDTDLTFTHDEHVNFNGDSYIITSIHDTLSATCK